MASDPIGIEVEGARELRRHLARIKNKELNKQLKTANKEAAEPVADKAKQLAPVRSGRLARSIKSAATLREGRVKAGSAARVPYAGPIHFGWPSRPNPARGWRGGPIRPQPFIYHALDRRREQVRQAYEEAMDRLARKASTD